MLASRLNRRLLAALGLAALALACYPESLLPPPTVPSVPTISSAESTALPAATATEAATLPPPATPQDTHTGIDAVTRALQAGDAKVLSGLLLDQVWLAQGPGGDNGQSLSKDEMVKWLDARWGNKRTVVASDFVEHFVLLEINTSGWVRLAPVQAGALVFNLHRYNAQGQVDNLQGAWRIDTILYQ